MNRATRGYLRRGYGVTPVVLRLVRSDDNEAEPMVPVREVHLPLAAPGPVDVKTAPVNRSLGEPSAAATRWPPRHLAVVEGGGRG